MKKKRKDSFIVPKHLLEKQKWYMLLLFTFISIVIGIIKITQKTQLIQGQESFFQLSGSLISHWINPLQYLLTILIDSVPFNWLIFFPAMIGICSIIMFYRLAENNHITKKFQFFFMGILILSPAFIYNHITISAYSFFMFIFLSGIILLQQKKIWLRIISFIPLFIATLFDGISSLIVIIFCVVYFFKSNVDQLRIRRYLLFSIIFLTLFSLFSVVVWSQPFFMGPFHQEDIFADLIATLGGLSGISFFILILSLIGIAVTWKERHLYLSYIFLPVVIAAYIANTHTIFYLSIVLAIFGAIGFQRLLERTWELNSLKNITAFILLLGILFSTLSFIDRVHLDGPTNEEVSTLNWIKENHPNENEPQKIFSSLENSYYIKYYTNHEPFASFDSTKVQQVLARNATSAEYITDLFPILDSHNVSLLYITKKMRKTLPEDQNLLFLLQNERFKLVHSSEEAEVWMLEKEKINSFERGES